jgi:hypothetical protein
MPTYAEDDKIVCFFQGARQFESRYSTLGSNDRSNLDEGTMWPTAYAVTDLTEADVERIEALIGRAVS